MRFSVCSHTLEDTERDITTVERKGALTTRSERPSEKEGLSAQTSAKSADANLDTTSGDGRRSSLTIIAATRTRWMFSGYVFAATMTLDASQTNATRLAKAKATSSKVEATLAQSGA